MASAAGLAADGMYWRAADRVETFAGAASPINVGDKYVSRIRGYIIPPASGNYTFWLSSDDDAQLRISSSESKFSARLAASVEEWTYPQEWDWSSGQKSAPQALIAGQKVFFEIIQQDKGGGDHVEIAWQMEGGQRELIPASALESYTGDSEDADNDELPDDWEMLHGFSVVAGAEISGQGPAEDPDQDGYTNWEEASLGMDPWAHGGLPGSLLLETWGGIFGKTVQDFETSPRFFQPANVSEFISEAAAPSNRWDYIGSRMRGYLIPPVSGEYELFLAGDDGSELRFSPSASQFQAETIAAFDGYTASQEWFKFATQRSGPLMLEAGKKYYIEALSVDSGAWMDLLEIGWKPPGSQQIEIIPGTALEAYAFDLADPDGDGEPDDWTDFDDPDAEDPRDDVEQDFGENPEEAEEEVGDSTNYAGGAAPALSPTRLKKKPDTSNLPAALAEDILGYWTFEGRKRGTSPHPVIFPDATGRGNDMTGTYAGGAQPYGMPSKAARVAWEGGGVKLPPTNIPQGDPTLHTSGSVLHERIAGRSQPAPFSISFWVKFGDESLRSIPLELPIDNPKPNQSHYRIIYSMFEDRGAHPYNNTLRLGGGKILAVRRDLQGLQWYVGGYDTKLK